MGKLPSFAGMTQLQYHFFIDISQDPYLLKKQPTRPSGTPPWREGSLSGFWRIFKLHQSTVEGRVGPGRPIRLFDRARHRWRNRCRSHCTSFTSCTPRFSLTRPAREFRSGLTEPTRPSTPTKQKPHPFQKKPPVSRRIATP